jgi:hypothetical protein
MDRKSLLVIDPGSVHFENGLRNVTLKWGEIEKIQVFPSRWGEKVYVRGEAGDFNFRMFSSISIGDEEKGRLGFHDGDKILEILLARSGLQLSDEVSPEKTYERIEKQEDFFSAKE